jgi:hypothetical protein
MTYTEALSHFITETRIEDLPPEVIETTRRCVLDWIGVTLGAAEGLGAWCGVFLGLMDDFGGDFGYTSGQTGTHFFGGAGWSGI